MEIEIAIPSHRRRDQIESKALKYLSECGFKPEKITIFTSDKIDDIEYNSLKEQGYKTHNTQASDLVTKLNAINSYYEEGQWYILIEDDVETLTKKKGAKTEPFTGLNELAKEGFIRCEKLQTNLWGINPVNNGFYMSNSVSRNLKLIAGYLFGAIAHRRKEMLPIAKQKHDYERTLLNYIYTGSTIRFNYIGQKSSSLTNKGGLQSDFTTKDRCKAEIKSNDYLLKRFPHLIRRQDKINRIYGEATELAIRRPEKGIDLAAYQEHLDSQI